MIIRAAVPYYTKRAPQFPLRFYTSRQISSQIVGSTQTAKLFAAQLLFIYTVVLNHFDFICTLQMPLQHFHYTAYQKAKTKVNKL